MQYQWFMGLALVALTFGCDSDDSGTGATDSGGAVLDGATTDDAGPGGSGGSGGDSDAGAGGAGGETPCEDGTSEACLVDACAGQRQCDEGVWSDCEPPAEVCNGIDDNCDGQIDEGDPQGGQACQTGQLGACDVGESACSDGVLACLRVHDPAPELCNGVDDDCDGEVDEDNPESGAACHAEALGVCAAGLTTCTLGAIACVSGLPGAEVCNGLDDNCDGVVDDNPQDDAIACDTGRLGVCATGHQACVEGAFVCGGAEEPSEERCDGLDTDCDGTTDNVVGLGDACENGVGACAAVGALGCGQVPALVCSAIPGEPSAEVCDQIDNDCDGVIDNDTCLDNDAMVEGVQVHVPEAEIFARGWHRCYTGTYDQTNQSLAEIRAACAGTQLMLACRPVGDDHLTLSAEGLAVEVLRDVGAEPAASHTHNGVEWYYNPNMSWGFAPAGAAVRRTSCDSIREEHGDQRMCWHAISDQLSSGYRCGNNSLNADAGWERIVYSRSYESVGSYDIDDGPAHREAQSFSCVEACSEVFGDGDWGCSTDPLTLNHRAHGASWGTDRFCADEDVDDHFVTPLDRNYDCGVNECSFSAYVADHCSAGQVNYCWQQAGLSFADVRQNIPVAELLGGGFERCWASPYMADELSLDVVRTACTGDVLLMGCQTAGDSTLRLGAMGERDEVFRDVGDAADASHQHNGVTWYFSESRSWGFAPGGLPVHRNSCDTSLDRAEARMCWHTGDGTIQPGWSCGELRNGVDDERVIYQRSGGL